MLDLFLKKRKFFLGIILGGFILLVICLVYLLVYLNEKNYHIDFTNKISLVMAAETDALSGYAWSDNIGWVSFNCLNDGSCETSDYGVGIDADGKLLGYAWSDNIGWISFTESDLTGCPSGACKAYLSGAKLKGWARALAGKNTDDGWDGWISLEKVPVNGPDYGVELNEETSTFEGYAWGDKVIGWLAFTTDYSQVEFRGGTPLITAFEVETVTTGEKPYADWTGENIVRCNLSSDTGYNEENICVGSDCLSVDNFLIDQEVWEETTYTLTCFNSGGVSTSFLYSAYAGFELTAVPVSVEIDFVAGGATTTPTVIGVNSLNGFVEDVQLSADLSNLPNSPIGDTPHASFSKNSLTATEYLNGVTADLEIFAPYRFAGKKSVTIWGNNYESVELIIDAGEIDPFYEEI